MRPCFLPLDKRVSLQHIAVVIFTNLVTRCIPYEPTETHFQSLFQLAFGAVLLKRKSPGRLYFKSA